MKLTYMQEIFKRKKERNKNRKGENILRSHNHCPEHALPLLIMNFITHGFGELFEDLMMAKASKPH